MYKTNRWLSGGLNLDSLLASEVVGESATAYIERVYETVELEACYYCSGYEVEQLLLRSIARIESFTCGEDLEDGRMVVELRGLPGSGCTIVSLLSGYMLRSSRAPGGLASLDVDDVIVSASESKPSFEGVHWPKVLYLDCASVRPSTRSSRLDEVVPNEKRLTFDDVLRFWTDMGYEALTLRIRKWFLTNWSNDVELTIVLDNADCLEDDLSVALAEWSLMKRVNLVLVNKSVDDLFRGGGSALTTLKTCIIRLSALEPDNVLKMLQFTRARRVGSARGSLSGQRGTHQAKRSKNALGSSCGAATSDLTSQLEKWSGYSIMEILLPHFTPLVDGDERAAINLVVRWCMMLTGGLPKRVQELCDRVVESILTSGSGHAGANTTAGARSTVAASDECPRSLTAGCEENKSPKSLSPTSTASSSDVTSTVPKLFDPHDLALELFENADGTANLIVERCGAPYVRLLADICLTAQIDNYSKFIDVLTSVTSAAAGGNSSAASLSTFGGHFTGLTGVFSSARNRTDSWSRPKDLSSPAAVGGSSLSAPAGLSGFCCDSMGCLLKMISLQKASTPVEDRFNKMLHERRLISHEDCNLVKKEWYYRNQMRVVCCGPEIRSGGGRVIRDLVSFSPFMLFNYHEGINDIVANYIKFSPWTNFHKGLFSWLSYRFVLLPLIRRCAAECAPLPDYVMASLIVGSHSWLDRIVWTYLLRIIHKIMRRRGSSNVGNREPSLENALSSTVKILAIYCGFVVPSSKDAHPRDTSFNWMKYESHNYQIFSKCCHHIHVCQYQQIISHAFESSQRAVTLVLEAFSNHLVIVTQSHATIYDIHELPDVISSRSSAIQKIIPKVLVKRCSEVYPDFS